MSHSSRTVVAVALGLHAVLTAAVDIHAAEPRRIIRVYDTAAVDSAARAAAIHTAAGLLADAGIDTDWHDCTVGGAHFPCVNIRGAGDLVVRIAPTFVAGTKMPDGSISTRQTPSDPDLQLGFASFDGRTRTGVLATIFRDRVRAVAHRANVEYSELLGRAVAHEVGHLMLRASGHGLTGLMRAIWTDAEMTENRPEDWVFSQEERDRLRATAIAAHPAP